MIAWLNKLRPGTSAPVGDAKWAGLAKRGAGFAVLVALLALANGSALLRPVDDGLAETRFRLLQREPSGTIAVVEIDTPSIRAAGRWPWGRDRFGQAIENLQQAGARSVGFDVDFSAPSQPQADAQLAAAIRRRPASVVLPTFVQPSRKAGDAGELIESSPLGALSDEALLASVNVPADDDGRVRRYGFGFGEGAAHRQTIGGVLAGADPHRSGTFLIDYGVRAEAIPRLSFEDVYQGRFDPKLVAGKNIIVGATALELGDEFATPRHGTLSGVYVHALAYESLWYGRALTTLAPGVMLALALLAAFLMRPRRGAIDLRKLMAVHAAVAAAAVLLPLGIQAVAPVSLDTGIILLAQALTLIWAARAELDRRAAAIVKARESSLLHAALHEPETELPNRRALSADIAKRLERRDGMALAVVAVGIDRYPIMRGAIGYGLATQVVQQLARRVSKTSGEPKIAHLSTSVLGLVMSANSAEGLKARIRDLELMDPSLQVGEHAVDAFVRLGVAYLGPHGQTAENLLEHASIALDQARQLDRRLVVFDEHAFVDPSLNLALMSEMRHGLRAGELSLHYQPKLTLADGRVKAAEALVRWRHPERGMIAPDAFIPAAEETGNIRALTEWALAQAIADQDRLAAAGQELEIALNVSARLLGDRDFRRKALRIAASRRGQLTFEITESAVVENPQAAMAAIAAFRQAGLGISIDDYGAGLSSLAYLKMLEADELKLDKSLVSAVATSTRDRLILKSTVELAHSLGMKVVAEGVEDAMAQRALAKLGCDVVQGYLVSKPLPTADLLAFLNRRRTRAQAAR
ncbi:putative bifunctional diguanylate cyclase/phosphodiesterase [Phenylobacterium sp.]|uniref:putative bifunctional diguanylate cyclase/phosphodiesterase n=1 Tax=Phenylobacterium sp. TaxID=1871053 RepID=UPI002F939D7C